MENRQSITGSNPRDLVRIEAEIRKDLIHEVLYGKPADSTPSKPAEPLKESDAIPPITTPSAIHIPASIDFGIEDIVKTREGDFEFKGLLTPEGLWDSITLAGQQYENGKTLDYNQWIQYSNGTHGLDTKGNFVKLPKPVERKFRITPSRLRGWLMRATCEISTKPGHEAEVKELTEIFNKDDHNPWQHNAELIQYKAGEDARIVTQGWSNGHPFERNIPYQLAGDSPVEIVKGCMIGDKLYVIVGDNEPARVKQVMEYHDKPTTGKTYFYTCDTGTTEGRVVVFGVNYYDFSSIGTDYYVVSNDWPARGVFADEKNFHRK